MSSAKWTSTNLSLESSKEKKPITFSYRLFTRSTLLAGSSSNDDTFDDLPYDPNDGDILADGAKTFHYKGGQWCRAGPYVKSARTAKKTQLATDANHAGLKLRITDGVQQWATQSAFRCVLRREAEEQEANKRGKKRSRLDTASKYPFISSQRSHVLTTFQPLPHSQPLPFLLPPNLLPLRCPPSLLLYMWPSRLLPSKASWLYGSTHPRVYLCPPSVLVFSVA
jgi:hypothetical protein